MQNQSRVRNKFDVISPSRYISHVRVHGNRLLTPKLEAKFVGEKGVLVQADCLDLLANMKANSIDLIFVDPPFNLKKSYDEPGFSDKFAPEFYRGWCRTWLLECVRVLRPGGALFLYHLPKWLIDLGAWLNTVATIEYKAWIALKMKSGFPLRGRIHPAHYGLLYYVKSGRNVTFNVVRQRSPRCRKCGELVRDYGGYRDKYKKFEYEGDMWVQVSDVWEDTRPASHDKVRKTRINELPLQISERAILMASKPGDIVLDCFAGGGSTLHAAENHQRLWIGADAGDCEASLQRIKTFLTCRETRAPGKKFRRCFSAEFIRVALSTKPGSKTRPIRSVATISDLKADKFKSKSRVFSPRSPNGKFV
jgi:site-specific DNA-methyltransferase (adenine-specific)